MAMKWNEKPTRSVGMIHRIEQRREKKRFCLVRSLDLY